MTIITTGAGSPNNSTVARQDLRDVIQDQPLFNLYLLALQRLQQVDQTDLHSWYRIAGIHGRPYLAYDGVNGVGNFGGYCTHSSILFPTWHRPYLALYEQTLTKLVSDIANEFTGPEKQNYVNAASRFRIPYWDWASDSTLPDVVASQDTIQVTTPQGIQTIPNPLYSYTFNPLPADFGVGLPDEQLWESWPMTLRWPSTDDQNATSQPDVLESQLQNNALTIRDRTYNLLTQATTYAAFSNDGYAGPQSDPRWYDSLESIHNQIHGLTGGNGHMGVVDYAAFDPVFYLHHTNVDRMFAIWQVLNPNSYVIPRPNDAGTFTTEPGTVENANSPLEPFWQAQKKFWTSTTARHTNTFFYTYPELAKLTNLPPKQQVSNLRAQINSLYGTSGLVTSILPIIPAAAAAPEAPPAQKVLSEPVKAPAVKPPSGPTSEELPIDIAQGSEHHGKDSFYEWIVNIKVEKYAVKSTFFVQVFLGDPPSDPKKWGEDPDLVGTHVVFANNAHHTKCERCIAANEERKLVTGMIPLTGALGDKLGKDKLKHLEPDLVVPYLKKHLHWRIQKHDRSPVKLEDIPSLSVSVGHMLVKIPKHETEFPVWGEMNIAAGATAGKPGGTSHPH